MRNACIIASDSQKALSLVESGKFLLGSGGWLEVVPSENAMGFGGRRNPLRSLDSWKEIIWIFLPPVLIFLPQALDFPSSDLDFPSLTPGGDAQGRKPSQIG